MRSPCGMSTAANKQLMQHIFDELATGNSRPFLEAMAADFTWTITGSTPWSRTYKGAQVVRRELLRPLTAHFAETYTNSAQRFIAENDTVVVECRGRVLLNSGQRYDNTYCWVCTVRDGKLVELVEYLDTALLMRVLPTVEPATPTS